MDYYLKADNEQALWSALVASQAATQQQIKDETGAVVETRYVPAKGYDIDIIGTIQKPTGNFTEQTVEGLTVRIPEMTILPGFHANLRGPADLAPVVTVVPYEPTMEELADPDFVAPAPTTTTTPSPIQDLLVYPQSPSRVWF